MTFRLPRPLRCVVPVLLVLGAACGDAVGPEQAATPSAISVPTSAVRAHVEVLAHDSLCGRLVGTAYERAAAAYIADRFSRAGLAPGGTDGFFQEVSIGPVGRESPPTTEQCTFEVGLVSQNVIGVLPGAGGLAGEWVILGAHYDHVGWREQDGLTAVFNGADDNASGTALVIEVGRLLAAWVAAHPEMAATRRSIMFHAYGAEEIGLFGSRQFALTPTVPGESIYAAVNMDMVGRLRDGALTIAGESTSSAWSGVLAASRPDGIHFVFNDDAIDRSDQWSFISFLQVPALHFFTGLHPDYHTPADDPPLLDYDGMTRIGQLALGVLWDLATRTDAM